MDYNFGLVAIKCGRIVVVVQKRSHNKKNYNEQQGKVIINTQREILEPDGIDVYLRSVNYRQIRRI